MEITNEFVELDVKTPEVPNETEEKTDVDPPDDGEPKGDGDKTEDKSAKRNSPSKRISSLVKKNAELARQAEEANAKLADMQRQSLQEPNKDDYVSDAAYQKAVDAHKKQVEELEAAANRDVSFDVAAQVIGEDAIDSGLGMALLNEAASHNLGAAFYKAVAELDSPAKTLQTMIRDKEFVSSVANASTDYRIGMLVAGYSNRPAKTGAPPPIDASQKGGTKPNGKEVKIHDFRSGANDW